MSIISDNIRRFRIYKSLSQKELADKVGRTPTVISNWENGVHTPDIETIQSLCRVFEVTPNQLLGWEDSKEVDEFFKKQESVLQEIERLNRARDRIDERIDMYYKELKSK